MKPLLFALALFFFLLLFSSCGPAPTRNGSCIHPGVLGGAPFKLPVGSYWDVRGLLHIPLESGEITLSGAFCYMEGGK